MFTPIALAAAAGVASHVLYFNRGEHHEMALGYVQIALLSFVGGTMSLIQFNEESIVSALLTTLTLFGSFLIGLYTSVLLWRGFLSPWNKFPGPFAARFSDFYMTALSTNLDMYYKLSALHKQYGKFVRIGPNTLSVSDADLHSQAFVPNTTFRKAQWYDASKPFVSMHTTRDKPLHDRRRRVWIPALGDRALKQYEPKIAKHNRDLLGEVRKREGQPIDVSMWFNLYAFDVMGHLAFGKDYKMVEAGKRPEAIDTLGEGMEISGYNLPTWLFRMMIAIPGAASSFKKCIKFCRDELEWRHQNKNSEDDIVGWLFKGYEGPKPYDDAMFQADSMLVIAAGSDTTSSAMSFLFYELATRPEEIKKIRDELYPMIKGDNWTDFDIRSAPHLNGAINETLRLHPPIPSGVQRKVPPEGAMVNGTFLPGGTIFWMPQYVISREEEYYEKADQFVPERWYSKPDMIKHKNAFAPFSLGPENCVGKNLAFMEMRTLSAKLLLNYDMAFAPGEDGKRIKTKTKNHFTTAPGSLELIFTPV